MAQTATGEQRSVVDMQVYHRHQQMRLMGCVKLGDTRVLRLQHPTKHTADTNSHTNSNLRQGSTHRTAPWAMGQQQHNVSKHSLGSQPDSAAGASTARWTDHQHTHPQQACDGAPKHICTHNSHTLCAQIAYQQQDSHRDRLQLTGMEAPMQGWVPARAMAGSNQQGSHADRSRTCLVKGALHAMGTVTERAA
jgi:hypothetical protein